MRAPVLGGNFGVWGGLFSTFDCAVKGIRKKEDAYVLQLREAGQNSAGLIVFTDIDVTGTTRLHVTLAPFMHDILTRRRLPGSSRAVRWQFEVDTKQRGTVP